jgi:DNA-binding transcriptional LysR family regulator
MDRFAIMKTFVTVVDQGGFSAAGRRLDMSPQGVSNQIASLESTLGARLLNRTTRKISLTEVGGVYYARCRQILADMDEAHQLAGALQSTLRGTLKINVATSLGPLIAPATAEFAHRYPEVHVDITTTDRMVDLVEEGFDLSVRNAPIVESRLIVRELATFRFVVCGSPAYFRTFGVPQTPDELRAHNFLIFSPPPWTPEWRFQGPAGTEVIRISGNLRCTNGDMLRAAAVLGQGLLVTPEYTIREHLAAGRLVTVVDDYPLPDYPITVFYQQRHELSAKVRSFVDVLAKHFGPTSNGKRRRKAVPRRGGAFTTPR